MFEQYVTYIKQFASTNVLCFLTQATEDPACCPLLYLLGFDTILGLHYDPMHTIGGVIKDILALLLTSERVKDNVLK